MDNFKLIPFKDIKDEVIYDRKVSDTYAFDIGTFGDKKIQLDVSADDMDKVAQFTLYLDMDEIYTDVIYTDKPVTSLKEMYKLIEDFLSNYKEDDKQVNESKTTLLYNKFL